MEAVSNASRQAARPALIAVWWNLEHVPAAHCSLLTAAQVRLGGYRQPGGRRGANERRRAVRALIHPRFKTGVTDPLTDDLLNNDVALLLLDRPSTMPPVRLARHRGGCGGLGCRGHGVVRLAGLLGCVQGAVDQAAKPAATWTVWALGGSSPQCWEVRAPPRFPPCSQGELDQPRA